MSALIWIMFSLETVLNVCIDLNYVQSSVMFCLGLKDILGLLHVVVKRVILRLCIWKSIVGKLVLDTSWRCGDFLPLHDRQCNLILCHYCTHKSLLVEKRIRCICGQTPHHSHLGYQVSGGEAGSAAQWADTGCNQIRNRGFLPTTALWDVSKDADEKAQRETESCSSSGTAHSDTGKLTERRGMWCCWHCRGGEKEEHQSQKIN